MLRYLRDRSISGGELWYLTTEKGVSRETVAAIQKRIHRLQHERDFYKYTAWCFETRPKLHAHFLFVGDTAVVERLRRSAFASGDRTSLRAAAIVCAYPGNYTAMLKGMAWSNRGSARTPNAKQIAKNIGNGH